MQVTKGTWRMREQCVPGSLSSSPAQEPGNEAMSFPDYFLLSGLVQITVTSCQLGWEFKNASVNSELQDSLLVLFLKYRIA